jgi:hypothetical protein
MNLENGKIDCATSSNALTVAIKTLAGNDPSPGDPVVVYVRNQSGGIDALSLTAATTITLSAGSSLGTTSGIPFRLWLVAFNDGGTVRLSLINCRTTTGIAPLDEGLVTSSSAEGGSGGADSAGGIYSSVAVSDKPIAIIGYLEFWSGQASAGQWVAEPDASVLFGPGCRKPGEVIQPKWGTSTTQTSVTTTTWTDTSLSVSMNVLNPCNLIYGHFSANMQVQDYSGHYGAAAVFRSGSQMGFSSVEKNSDLSGNSIGRVFDTFVDFPGASGTMTWTVKVKAGTSGKFVNFPYNAGEPSGGTIQVSQVMC